MMQSWFTRFARKSAKIVGSAPAFMVTVGLTVVWLAFGPSMDFSDAWNFWANTVSTIVTTMIVVLIQNTQNTDTKALHEKLDGLIEANAKVSNSLVGIENRDA